MADKSKKELVLGVALCVSFLVVLVLMFTPIFGGENGLRAADRLFNSIAKGSTYYIPDLLKESERYQEAKFEATIKLPDADMADKAKKLLAEAGVGSSGADVQLKLIGYLGPLFQAALKDSDAMFNNRGAEISAKYGFPGKEALYVWWKSLGELAKDFRRQKRFADAAFLDRLLKKGVEVGYNFSGIAPQSASTRAGILAFALVFYVVYTLWWGMGIYCLFEGLGLKMKAGVKKEV
jgi:hypothetical protein